MKVFECTSSQVEKWWQPLVSLGYEVLHFERDKEAVELAKSVMGHAMWDDSLIRDDFGGLVFSRERDAFVWVSIHDEARFATDLTPGNLEVCFNLIPPKKLRRSMLEKRLLHDIERVFSQRGIVEVRSTE